MALHTVQVADQLCKVLRPHQREGVQFVFECGMCIACQIKPQQQHRSTSRMTWGPTRLSNGILVSCVESYYSHWCSRL